MKKIAKKLKRKAVAVLSLFICITFIFTVFPRYVTDTIASIIDIEIYEQECPELVRAYLQGDYEKFEKRVRMYCDDPDFLSFVAASEFDNAYTKLVYGGTSAYTQEELKGNYEGVQGQSASWVAEETNGKYSAKSVLQTIEEYKDAGLSDEQIIINDNYLKGYGDSSGYKSKDGGMKFSDWINYSYYTIPFYYHWNMARQSEYTYPLSCLGIIYNGGTKVGLPNWLKDEGGNWKFMHEASIDGKGWSGSKNYVFNTFTKNTDKSFYNRKNYKDYLDTGWTALTPKNNKNNKDKTYYPEHWEDYENGNTAAYAEGVMLGYKMAKVDTWFEKAFNTIFIMDPNYNYYPFSKYFYTSNGGHNDISKYGAGVNDLYVYDWYDLKSGNKSNYEKYLANPKDTKTLGKREKDGISVVNTEIENWKDHFAEFFAKEIYYVYPNTQYVKDYFMSDDSTIPREKKVAFLQRSFYAMATGASLDCVIDEGYTVKNGEIVSDISGNAVGNFKIKNVKITELKPVYYESDTDDDTIKDYADNEEIKKKYNEWTENNVRNTFKVVYSASIKISYKDKNEDLIENIPVELKIGRNVTAELTLNPKGYDSDKNMENGIFTLTKKEISKIVNQKLGKDTWLKSYYKSQYSEDSFYGSDGGNLKDGATNPLDGLQIKSDAYRFATKTYTIMDDTAIGGTNIMNFLNINYSYDAKKQATEDSFINLFNGYIAGEREIQFEYSDHSFLNYEINEIKDSNGELTEVNIEIYTYYPDVTKYSEGNYRVAYGFETKGAITEAYKLLQYFYENDQTLYGVSDEVDFSQLIISDDESYIENGVLLEADDLTKFCISVIKAVEGGTYDHVSNGSLGEGITIGISQWWNTRGWNVLKRISDADKEEAKKFLGDVLYRKVQAGGNGQRYLSDDETKRIRKLLQTEQSVKVQDEQFKEDVEGYISIIKNDYKITDDKCIAYISQLYHNHPASARQIMQAFIEHYGGVEHANNAEDRLETLKRLSQENGHYRSIPSRLVKAYEACLKVTNISGNVTEYSKDIVKWLESKVGCIYSQANRATGLGGNSYDCSSLAYYAWTIKGVKMGDGTNIPNAAAECEWCEKYGTKSSLDKLQPGDLLFYSYGNNGRYRGISHVAIYVGGGKVIEAADEKQGIIKGNVYTNNFVAAYRPTRKD